MNNQEIKTQEFRAFDNNQVYVNPKIIITSSNPILQKIDEHSAVMFTVNRKEFEYCLLEKSIEKDSGRRFENCESHFIPNSYLEIHINNDVRFNDKDVCLVFKKRLDDRGLNIFVQHPKNEASHNLSVNTFHQKDSFYNEIHLKTNHYSNELIISIEPK